MAVLKDIVAEEYQRLIKMEKLYKEKIKELPKGSITYKKIKGQLYPYLSYREGLKVKTIYLKMDESELAELKTQIEQRKHFEKVLEEIRKDMKIAKKVLR